MKRILLSLFTLGLCLTMTAHDAVPFTEQEKEELKRADTCYQIATDYYYKGYYREAIPYAEMASDIYGRIYGYIDTIYARSLSDLGVIYNLAGEYEQAKRCYQLSVDVMRWVVGEHHADYASALENLGTFYFDMGEYEEAKNTFEKAQEIRKETLGKRHPDYARGVYNLATLYYSLSQYDTALVYHQEALKIRKRVLNKNHADIAASFSGIGSVYDDKGDFVRAKKYFLKALKVRKNGLGETHPDYAKTLDALGFVYYQEGDYVQAQRYFHKAEVILRNTLGEEHPDYAISLSYLGEAYEALGDFEKAKQYYLQTIAIQQNAFGEDHPLCSASYGSIGVLYTNMGDYKEAEQYLEHAAAIQLETFGERTQGYAIALNNLGNLYLAMGDNELAEQCYLVAADIYLEMHGEKHPDYASLIHNLGTVYSNAGMDSLAEAYYLYSLDLLGEIFGEDHPLYANTLHSLGSLYADYSFTMAEEYYLRALDLQKKIYGERHPTCALTLSGLGSLYYNNHDYAQAKIYYFQALKIRKKTLNENHPDVAASLYNLCLLYDKIGDYAQAESYLRASRQIYNNNYMRSLDFMTEYQRSLYWSTMSDNYESTVPWFSYHYYSHRPSIASFAYDNELFHKGLLLNSSNVITRSILESGDTTLVQQWNDLTTKKQQIIVLEQNDPQSEYVAQLRDEAEVLEKAITKSSAAYRENLRQWNVTWDSVRNVLKPNQVAIEYMSAPLNDDSTMYCALLVRDTCTYPILIPLFNEPDVAGLLHTSTGDTAKINATYQYHHNGRKLAHYIWDPVETYIHPGEEVFFSPTGVLHQIAIENLPYDSMQTYGDVYSLVRLSSTRELVLNKPAAPHEKAALYGGIFYEPLDSVKLRRISEKYRPAKRSTPSFANDTTKRSMAEYLPFTKDEIDSINMLLSDREVKVTVYRKNEACEESLKALSGQKQNVLHLATHGFFWTDSAWSPDPMDRCGLLFAWANTALSGYNDRLPKGADDGILTAKEISVLDFRGADIVVMSACETGLGDISGEGVFGLQRAFKMAGAQTVLMALWQVNDKATQKLMTAFYRYMSDGYSKREAFHMAQQEVRNYTETKQKEKVVHKPSAVSHPSSAREKFKNKGKSINSQDETAETVIETIVTHPYQSPYYWAGFILLD